jgi:large subunit GTPase 1
MVGYPNVGKSSLINALIGEKKVSMSRQPGKTKHFQTIEVPNRRITLCDCPGLVFPSVVATKAHLVIRAVQPIDVTNDTLTPVQLIVEKVGLDTCLRKYKCAEQAKAYMHESSGRILLSAMAVKLGHLLRMSEPDISWSARRVLRDFTEGWLLYCEKPPGMEEEGGSDSDADAADAAAAEKAFCAAEGVADVADFLAESAEPQSLEAAVSKMNKRQMRQMQKSMGRRTMQLKVDGVADPFARKNRTGGETLGDFALGQQAMRVYQSGRSQ